MPRVARKNLCTPYIHVMVQGINKEYIFNNEKELKRYLYFIRKDIDSNKFSLLAFCMMNNHAHFLFSVKDYKAFTKHMKMANQNYAQKYNKENERCGKFNSTDLGYKPSLCVCMLKYRVK